MKAEEKQWIEQHLGEHKHVFQYQEVSATPLGTVVKVINGADSFYFKTDTLLACEAAKTACITHLLPTLTPTLVASCSEQNWLLTKQAGKEVLYSVNKDNWLNAVTTLASIHKHRIKTSESAIFPKHSFNKDSFYEFLIHPEYLNYWQISLQARDSLQCIAEEIKSSIKKTNEIVPYFCL